jgi:hypothetical protein
MTQDGTRAVPGAVGATAPTDPDAELLALWARIRAADEALALWTRQQPNPADSEIDAACRPILGMEADMAAMQPQTAAGVLAMLELIQSLEGLDKPKNFAHDNSPGAWRSVLASLRRMAGKAGAA